MEFDVFDKLSDLETKIHLQKEEISKKDEYINQILENNEVLRKQIEVCIKELNGYRKSQLSVPVATFDKEVQTDGEVKVLETSDGAFAGNETSIADILKQTSDSVTQNSGYVFDQKTGLYFDSNSGYYYDPENQLFFEPKRGVYYTYDNETQEYSYHSRVSSELSEKFKILMDKSSELSSNAASSAFILDKDEPPTLIQRRQRHRTSYSPRSSSYRSRSRSSSSRSRRRHRRRSRSRSRRSRHRRSRRSYSSASSRSIASGESPYLLHRRRRGGRYRCHNSSRSSSSYSNDRRSRKTHRNLPSCGADPSPPPQKPACIAAVPIVYPPSVRLMVLASNTAALPVGSVGVISSHEASTGWGCLGRNWNYCPLFNLTQDTDLEEIHCEIIFDKGAETYSVKDKKTANGTFLNGAKLEKHGKKQLTHGDVLRLGANKFLVHIHPGRESCGQCEAAEVKAAMETVALTNQQSLDEAQLLADPSVSKESVRRANINALKLKYGLKKTGKREGGERGGNKPRRNKGFDQQQQQPPQYEDRAAKRRAMEKRTQGTSGLGGGDCSTDLSSAEFAPTASLPASVHMPIDEGNLGARMLSKMGWSRGEGLGREKAGIAEPISASLRLDQRAGLGFGNTPLGPNAVSVEATPSDLRHARTLSVTRERYRLIEEQERGADPN